jgi:hypothetical protein
VSEKKNLPSSSAEKKVQSASLRKGGGGLHPPRPLPSLFDFERADDRCFSDQLLNEHD